MNTNSNLNSTTFEGIYLDGTIFKLQDQNFDRIALNVYSPTCVPCVKEIPALNFIASKLNFKKNIGIFIAVDPYLLIENSEKKSFEELLPQVTSIMTHEKKIRNIQLPIIVMKKPFSVNPQEGFVTATPETLLFKIHPYSYYYNFIGSISETSDPAILEKDPKVQFVLKKLGGSS